MAADLLAVAGDPLVDPAVLAEHERIRMVARDGVLSPAAAPRDPHLR
jgi:hypothetical protein